MNIDDVQAYRRHKDHLMRHGYDYQVVSPNQKITHDFVDKDSGDYDNKHLGTKIVTPKDSESNMPEWYPKGLEE